MHKEGLKDFKLLSLNAGHSTCVRVLYVLGVRIKIIGSTRVILWRKDVADVRRINMFPDEKHLKASGDSS